MTKKTVGFKLNNLQKLWKSPFFSLDKIIFGKYLLKSRTEALFFQVLLWRSSSKTIEIYTNMNWAA